MAGITNTLSKIHVLPESVNRILFGNRVFVDAIKFRWRSSQKRVRSQSNDGCSYKKREIWTPKHRDTQRESCV